MADIMKAYMFMIKLVKNTIRKKKYLYCNRKVCIWLIPANPNKGNPRETLLSTDRDQSNATHQQGWQCGLAPVHNGSNLRFFEIIVSLQEVSKYKTENTKEAGEMAQPWGTLALERSGVQFLVLS